MFRTNVLIIMRSKLHYKSWLITEINILQKVPEVEEFKVLYFPLF